MSGSILMSKDLPTDPHFRRLVRDYEASRERYASDAKAFTRETAISHMLGAVTQLWMYADTHIRKDNTVDLSMQEVDELVGIPGFSQLMPDGWLRETEDGRIELPDFLEHNGTVARKKASGARRQARYRANQKQAESDASALQDDSKRNAGALPSHPFPSPPIPSHSESARAVVPRETNLTREEGTDAVVRDLLERIQASYPKGIYRQSDWLLVEREIRALLDEGQDPGAMLAGVERYAAQVRARGCEETEFVMAPLRFFHDRQFFEEFPLPKAEKRGKGPSAEEAERDDMRKLRDRRAAIGLGDFREPNPGETADEYRRAQDVEFNARQPRDVHAVAQRLVRAKAVA